MLETERVAWLWFDPFHCSNDPGLFYLQGTIIKSEYFIIFLYRSCLLLSSQNNQHINKNIYRRCFVYWKITHSAVWIQSRWKVWYNLNFFSQHGTFAITICSFHWGSEFHHVFLPFSSFSNMACVDSWAQTL